VHAHELVGARGGDGGVALRFNGDKRERRGECRQRQRVRMALEAAQMDTWPPHRGTAARWRA
jgi:hypothetical protein